jgi:hypothetical protein
MAITFSNDSIKVIGGTYNLSQIYQEAQDANYTKMHNLDDTYIIDVDFIIGDGSAETHVADKNITLTIKGDLFQVYYKSSIKFGEKRADDSTLNGCTINCPNIKNGYGFGCTDKNKSGNAFLYGSVINIFGFWGFFKGDNHVEVINCFVDGFGRISGPNSILKNITYIKSNGRYGVISTKGQIKESINNNVYDSTEHTQGSVTTKCATYCNPKYAGDQRVIRGEFAGYDKLCFVENESGGTKLEFVDSIIKGTYDLYREDDNKIDFYHKFTFNPTFADKNGNAITDAHIEIKDKQGVVVFDDDVDINGKVNIELVKYFSDKDNTTTRYTTPHTMTVTTEDVTMTRKLLMDYPDKYNIITISSDGGSGGSSGDGCDCDTITDKFTETNNKLDNIHIDVRQLMLELIEDVQDNQELIEDNKNKVRLRL